MENIDFLAAFDFPNKNFPLMSKLLYLETPLFASIWLEHGAHHERARLDLISKHLGNLSLPSTHGLDSFKRKVDEERHLFAQQVVHLPISKYNFQWKTFQENGGGIFGLKSYFTVALHSYRALNFYLISLLLSWLWRIEFDISSSHFPRISS